ncbi:MAG: HipA domain-containing protein [Bacteroidetes bacterium]|nr:HipA domain-containing protein [Bacteroidota bacterium]
MGVLSSEKVRGKEVFSFEYDEYWLKMGYARLIDPELQLFKGKQYLADAAKSNFGVFTDSSPDRWGRVLMKRREAALARSQNRPANSLFETDYLLGVYDQHRMGGLRFKLDHEGEFLNNDKALAAPPWTSIRELGEISLRLEDEESVNDTEYLKWLAMLVAPGSSLGGARPKASILDEHQKLWIAKFPSKNDGTDVGAWEMVAYQLAKSAGLNLPNVQVIKYSKHHTFLSQRFDRSDDGRIHFASAMTLLGYTDGNNFHDGISYLELAEFISSYGANVQVDLEELWRRIVFSICVSNCDDHLRNHGFLLTKKGWSLSPAYDINPIETGTGLMLNISENDNALNLDLALEVAAYFRLSDNKANQILQKVIDATSNWQSVAKNLGLSNLEIDLKANAFKNFVL